MISNKKSIFVVAAIATLMIGASSVAIAPRAFAASSFVTVTSVPAVSFINKSPEMIKIHGQLNNGETIQKITVYVDKGTGSQHVYSFKPDGTVIQGDAGFAGVDCEGKISSGGYIVGPARIDCVLSLDKDAFSAGTHQVHVDVSTNLGTLSGDSHFTLKTPPAQLPDLVDQVFYAPTHLKRGQVYNTWVIESNSHPAVAGAHVVSVYLTSLSGANKVEVGHVNVIGLGGFQTVTLKIPIGIPSGYPLGGAFLVSFVDSANSVQESNENNNQLDSYATVTN